MIKNKCNWNQNVITKKIKQPVSNKWLSFQQTQSINDYRCVIKHFSIVIQIQKIICEQQNFFKKKKNSWQSPVESAVAWDESKNYRKTHEILCKDNQKHGFTIKKTSSYKQTTIVSANTLNKWLSSFAKTFLRHRTNSKIHIMWKIKLFSKKKKNMTIARSVSNLLWR